MKIKRCTNVHCRKSYFEGDIEYENEKCSMDGYPLQNPWEDYLGEQKIFQSKKNTKTPGEGMKITGEEKTKFTNEEKKQKKITSNHILKIYDRNKKQLEYVLENSYIEVGRKNISKVIFPEVDLTELDKEKHLSSPHIVLKYFDGKYIVCDIGSKNGTWLEGNLMESNKDYALKNGDRLILGFDIGIIYENNFLE